MPPKRKTEQEAEGETEGPAPKEAKGGLKAGDDLPDLTALETDESKPDDVKKISIKVNVDPPEITAWPRPSNNQMQTSLTLSRRTRIAEQYSLVCWLSSLLMELQNDQRNLTAVDG